VLSLDGYHKQRCAGILQNNGWNATAVDNLCNWMGYCGFPYGADTRETPTCNLYLPWTQQNGTLVPSNQQAAVCRTSPPNTNCPW
jgi:hypothetical protein